MVHNLVSLASHSHQSKVTKRKLVEQPKQNPVKVVKIVSVVQIPVPTAQTCPPVQPPRDVLTTSDYGQRDDIHYIYRRKSKYLKRMLSTTTEKTKRTLFV